ncbi:hypothetical protein TWF730_010708 [Orbilia blumenaviensis]|uniref:Uncharacterized protein n=1 Tax=Orbilia blumenaviensis TaxID=1796055 RepID=A0AAV9UST6_9PEZI
MEKSSSKRRHDSSNPNPTSKRSQPSRSSPKRSKESSKSKKSESETSSATKKSASDPVRLHITPLTAESAKAIVAAEHLSTASFHGIDTFPEKSYGFITVPRAEAEALRKKYNGTVFRGVKMSVEEARPAKEAVLSPNRDGAEDVKGKGALKRGKKEEGVLPGFELPEGRQVKRGWTKDAALKGGKNKINPAAGSSECLFKTVLPPVIAAEMKKSDFGEDKASKKKKSQGRVVKNQVVVKEFKNSTKFPSFLKMSSLPTDSVERSAEFVEGVGWVNDAGEVIEGPPAKRRRFSSDEESSKETEEGRSGSSSEDDGKGSDDSSEGTDARLTKSNSSTSSSSGPDSSESEDDDSDSSDEDESADDSKEAPSGKARSTPGTIGEASPKTSESSLSESTSNAEPEPESESESESESGSEAEAKESQKPDTASAAETPAKKTSSNFANLTNIFKPKLSLDTEASNQFKFFGADLDESDEQEGGAGSDMDEDQPPSSNRFDDSVLYTPITPQAERYRSGAPTPDTAIAPRFKDFLPFPKDFEISIKRNYFPTVTADQIEALRKPSKGVRLLFPHTYDDNLHAISIWSSVKLPKILTTGELPEKQTTSAQETDNPKVTEDIEMEEPREQSKPPQVTRQPVFAPKQKDNFAPTEIEQPKTGSGSKIVGWAGKKKTFDDDDDFDMTDAPAPIPPKAKTGVGSGVVGWAGKKMTVDNHGNDFAASPAIDHQARAKTGAGSGVTGWAGKKKTFDDNDEEELSAVAEASVRAKTGAGSGVTTWAGKKKTFDDDDDDEDRDAADTLISNTPKISAPVRKSQARNLGDDESESKKVQLPIAQMWEKVFYENRGDWNRQWKRKRREVAKAKRKKEKAKRGWGAVFV